MQRIRGWVPEIVSLLLFVVLTVALANGHLLALDLRVADWVDTHRPAPFYWTLRVFNYLGQGGQVLTPVAIILTAFATWRLRSVRPVLLFGSAYALFYLTIGPLKIWFDRAAPHFEGANREILFNPDPLATGSLSMSYPSGHVANALAWYGVIAVLINALLAQPMPDKAYLALRILPPAIVFVTTTYLAFHWITDSVAGLLLGLILTRILARVAVLLGFRPRTRTAAPVSP
ncbi:phosphatase PAP2 family protein [Winogradskya humida]|nr:phosphatase PAP2 family protein [Actinoplanes humidus]